MHSQGPNYRAIVSSDWNECLAPTGPFDVIMFHHPELASDLMRIFQAYTGNRISLGKAVAQLRKLLPGLVSRQEMDQYLEASFKTYRGVTELIRWCRENEVLFMINTTAFQGFCERAMAKGLIPEVPVVSAHPLIRYGEPGEGRTRWMDLRETSDKALNTELVMKDAGLGPEKVLIMGDSGGDGPHFQWGASVGARLVGSMTKASLAGFCAERDVEIHTFFGPVYKEGEARDFDREMAVDFMDLVPVIEEIL